jgi:F-type H+-transporting ATPase subunit delta
VLAELSSLVHEVLPQVPRIGKIFGSPRVPTDRKEELIGRIAGGRMLPTTIHALHVLARHDRLGLLADVVNAAERLADALEGRRQATVTTAFELDAGERERLVDEVQRALGVTLATQFAVDPDLIGGLVVRIDDTVYDQSVVTSLRRLGHRLKKRSIHEIQYGRDRLGSA